MNSAFGVDHPEAVEKAFGGLKAASKFSNSLGSAEFKSYQGGLKTTGMKQDLGLKTIAPGGAHRAGPQHRAPGSRAATTAKVVSPVALGVGIGVGQRQRKAKDQATEGEKDPMGKSAFGVEHLEKALTGTKGDKRNTKAVGAVYGGAAVGAGAGRQVATRTAGTTPGDVRRLASSVAPEHFANAMSNAAAKPHPEAKGTAGLFRQGFKEGRSGAKAAAKVVHDTVPGAARMVTGHKVGSVLGAAGGAAAFAAARRRKKS